MANQNLSTPTPGTQGAIILENIFPTATGAVIRRGSDIYATLGAGDLPVTALFTYNFGNNKKFFGATETTVFDITTVSSPINYQIADEEGDNLVTDLGFYIGQLSTVGLEAIEGMTGGNWIDEQFATTGGNYLIIVNGADPMHVFDGTMWYAITDEPVNRLNFDAQTVNFTVGQTVTGGTSGATATIVDIVDNGATGFLILGTITGGPFQDNETITDGLGGSATADGVNVQLFGAITGTLPDGSPLQTSSFSYVWAYKNRLFFILKDSLDVYYLPVDQITGAATLFQMGAEFSLGGKLMIGATWAGDYGNGLNDNCIFVTDEGEIVVYNGTNPATAADWLKVGRYQLGKPRGPKAFIRAGGDLVFATSIGFVPLSQALNVDSAVLSSVAISYSIETAWNDAVALRSSEAWDCIVWDDKQMVVISLPTVNEQSPSMYVTNARTGAWGNFTNWSGTCLEIFNGRLFFGSQDGKVIEAWVTGLDQGLPYTATYVPLFTDFGNSGAQKIGKMARMQTRGPHKIKPQLSTQTNYVVELRAPPSATPVPTGSEWGTGTWGVSAWGSAQTKTWQGDWYSVGGIGSALAPSAQITSGSIVPLDAEIISIDYSYTQTRWGE
ncbi:hypothetical protein [Ensifer sp. SL37]|uniref:hypothetical protein n=1 Tax=Ensifer sp. SL37 TaxID=2995137 RepID=UPI0022768691|nr:hypothetical protein [Ensifer sp. SL37]MCY1741157.1 hypothetical protein [Ensifer sp. SL37]